MNYTNKKKEISYRCNGQEKIKDWGTGMRKSAVVVKGLTGNMNYLRMGCKLTKRGKVKNTEKINQMRIDLDIIEMVEVNMLN